MSDYVEPLAAFAVALSLLALIISIFMIHATRQMKPHLTNAVMSVILIAATFWAVSTHG